MVRYTVTKCSSETTSDHRTRNLAIASHVQDITGSTSTMAHWLGTMRRCSIEFAWK